MKKKELQERWVDWKINHNINLIRNSISWVLNENYTFQDTDGSSISVSSKLGSWWTKEVYNIEYMGKAYAMAIPWYIDKPKIIEEKRKKALAEIDNTNKIRDLWYYVNNEYFWKNILINGIIFPAIFMKPYSKHAFLIFDWKKASNKRNPLLSLEKNINDEYMISICSNILKEISKLIKDNISLGSDNFNMCIDQGEMHLYLNDLWNMKVAKIEENSQEEYIDYYLMFSIGVILNSLDEETYQKSKYLNRLESNQALRWKMKDIIKKNLQTITK